MTLKICPKCGEHFLKHIHNCAHGISGTHMAGSERFECECGYSVFASDKEEAEKQGLKFELDDYL